VQLDRTSRTATADIPPDLIAQLAVTVSETARRYETMGRPRDAVRVLETALTFGAPDLQPRDRALLLADLGGMLWKQGRHQEAQVRLAEARDLAAETGGRRALATALYHLGELAYVRAFLMGTGELDEAMDYHGQCLALRREMGDQAGVTLSLSRIGVLHERLGDQRQALANYQAAIQLAREIGYPPGLTRPYTHLGDHHRRQGELQTALVYYWRALTVAQEHHLQEDIALGSINVGWMAYRLTHDFEAAVGHFEHARRIAERLNFKLVLGRAYEALAELYDRVGKRQEALDHYLLLVDLSARAGYRRFLEPATRRLQALRSTPARRPGTRRGTQKPLRDPAAQPPTTGEKGGSDAPLSSMVRRHCRSDLHRDGCPDAAPV
jgi:tetratricopeptide (TPR) repeat protein